METLLDHLMNALPTMGELASVAIARPIERELLTLVPELVKMGASLAAVAFLKSLGLVVSGLFLTVFGVVLAVTSRSRQEVNTVKIELGKFKVAWQGVAGLGCMVAGTLVLLLAVPYHLT
jgi:hypothetical protein